MIKTILPLLYILFSAVCCSNEEHSEIPAAISIIKEDDSRNYNSVEKGFLDQASLDKLNLQINFYTLDRDDLSLIRAANNSVNDNSLVTIIIGENAVLLSMNIIVPQAIIFAGCFDDLSLSNIERSKMQNNNITGVYGDLDITKYIKNISSGNINKLGYLYMKKSRISSYMSEYIAEYCIKENIAFYPFEIEENSSSSDMEKIIGREKLDYILLANDNYIDNNIYSISYICGKYSIPMINTDISDALNAGILFSLDFNYYYLGRELAMLLGKVIENNYKTEGLDFVKVSNAHRILINEDVASSYNIKFTDEILKKSYLIVRDGKAIGK